MSTSRPVAGRAAAAALLALCVSGVAGAWSVPTAAAEEPVAPAVDPSYAPDPKSYDYATEPAAAAMVTPPPNRRPVAVPDHAEAEEGGTTRIDLFANDSDADGDALSLAGGTSAGHGSVSFDDGVATYLADPGFVGEDGFTYLVDDGKGGTASAAVSITVVRRAAAAQPVVQPRPAQPAPVVAPVVKAPVVKAPAVKAPVVTAPVVKAPVVKAPVTVAKVVQPRVRTATQPQQVRQAATTTRTAGTTTTAAVMGPQAVQPAGPAPAGVPTTLAFTGPTDTLLPYGIGLLLAGGLLARSGRRPARR